MLGEFRSFIMRGNVVDLAVGVIIGGAFGKIVNSLVEDIIMPPLGLLVGKVDFSNFFIPLTFTDKHYASIAEAKADHVVTWNLGMFGNTLFQFLLVAFSIFFFVVKPMNRFAKREEKKAEKAPPPRSEELLEEIRDLLKAKK